jgi:hypothetical protein
VLLILFICFKTDQAGVFVDGFVYKFDEKFGGDIEVRVELGHSFFHEADLGRRASVSLGIFGK